MVQIYRSLLRLVAKMDPVNSSSENGPKLEVFVINLSSRLKSVFFIPSSYIILNIFYQYTTNYKRGNANVKQQTAFSGNHIKSLHLSVEESLKNLRTSYIDILYVHWWDHATSIEEVMNGLHNLVVQGKVLYLGISDTPAWVVSKANQYARDHGKTPFVIYQGLWNAMKRDFEREIIPMARAEGALYTS